MTEGQSVELINYRARLLLSKNEVQNKNKTIKITLVRNTEHVNVIEHSGAQRNIGLVKERDDAQTDLRDQEKQVKWRPINTTHSFEWQRAGGHPRAAKSFTSP